jgi:glycolate oxidase
MAIKGEVAEKLMKIVGEKNCTTSTAELYVYAFDGGIHRRQPDAVVRPINTVEVQKIVDLANEYKIPLVPRGAGTALCGQVVPIEGGIIVDMQRMSRIQEIRVDGLYAIVEPGVVCDDFNATLKPYGYFIPGPASSEVATLGGMVATNSSGGKALKYGATRDYVLGMTVVMPTGDAIEVGAKTPKNSGGFQFEKFFCGMEGTLGIITEIVTKIAPIARKRAACVASFDDLEKTGQCVSNIIARGLIPSQLEIMGETSIKAVNKATGMGLLECAGMLLIEMDGHQAVVSDEAELVGQVCKDSGAIAVEFTDDAKRIEELWKGRKQMIPSLSVLQEEYATVMLADDMAVPIYNVPKALAAFEEISNQYDIHIPAYGHAGDGNLHTKVLMDPTNKEHWRQAEEAVTRVFDVVLALGGTTTGEHGIGITKAPFFHKERGGAVKVMKTIKKALDPNDIMNPRKLMDWEGDFITHLRYPLEGVDDGKVHLKEYLNEMVTCTLCGYCKGVCPVFKNLGWDTGAARGKVLLSYGVLSKEIDIDDSVAQRLYQCVLCGDCERRCPSDVKTPDMVKAARAELVDSGFAYKTHTAMVENILKTGNIFGDEDMKIPATDGETIVFVGCQYGSRPNKTKRYLRILDKIGINTAAVGELCCGFPMTVLGFKKAFEEYKGRFLDGHKNQEMIAFCPSCTMFLKEEYDFNMNHVVEVIADKLDQVDFKKAQGTVTYHDPCDLGRGLKLYDAPRKILETLGYELVEMKYVRDQSHCCGGGGGILTTDQDMSDDIAQERIDEAISTGTNMLVTACPTCDQVLKKAAQSTEGKPLVVRDLSDLLWQALK